MGERVHSPARALVGRLLPPVAIGLWVAATAVGLHSQWSYAATPGTGAAALPRWPARAQLPAPAGRSSLLVFAQPRCPCTRATLAELRALLSRAAQPPDATVVFVRPPGADEEWLHGELWDEAARIPGVRVFIDDDGAEATRFSAMTSGQVLIYGADRALRFSGGITALRGHAGDNLGLDEALAALAGRAPALRTHPVFGCALLGTSEGEL